MPVDDDRFRDIEVELKRVADRLNSMPLARAGSAAPSCRAVAEVVVARTRELTDDIPPDATLPDLGPQGLGALLTVVGRDFLAAARGSRGDVDEGLQQVLEALIELRRALP